MPKRTDIKKIMVIGSGPIVIGQAAEFDYAGTQACLALKEEGYEVVLVNSNPATIMTDKEIADSVYRTNHARICFSHPAQRIARCNPANIRRANWLEHGNGISRFRHFR